MDCYSFLEAFLGEIGTVGSSGDDVVDLSW